MLININCLKIESRISIGYLITRMRRNFIFLFLIGFCHQSCVIKKFVRKEMQVDLLPEFISSDSISVLEPAFSGHLSSSYDDIGVALPVLSGKQNVFKSEVEQLSSI